MTRTVIGAALLALAAATPANADTRQVESPSRLVTLRVAASDAVDVTWESWQPVDLEFHSFTTTDGSSVCVFYLASDQVVIKSDVIEWDARKRFKTTWIVRYTGTDPNPPPEPPEPRPDAPEGFAGLVYQEAAKVRQKANAGRLADNYGKVRSAIAAGGVANVQEAARLITDLNNALNLPEDWRPFGRWIVQQAKERATTLDSARRFFGDCEDGLRAASK